jgi:hypothetical protein
MSISERLKEKLSAIFRRKPSGKGPPLPAGSFVRSPIHPLRARLTTVSTWHEEMILLAHTSYLFAQSRIGTYPPFWALVRSPMQEHIDKLESTVLIPSASNLLFLPQTSHVLEVI